MTVTNIAKASSADGGKQTPLAETTDNGAALLAAADAVPEDVRKVILGKMAKEILDDIKANRKSAARYVAPKPYVPSPKVIQRVGHRMWEICVLMEGLHKQIYDLVEEAPGIECPLAVTMAAVRESAQACNAAAVALLGDVWDRRTLKEPLSSP
jgi:hypothetical protein